MVKKNEFLLSTPAGCNVYRVADYRYLIVGGTTKAATTSLFAYLADHPAICAATYKETRFFLSSDYPLPSKYRYKGNIEEYNVLFSDSDETQLRMESTPDYLYCEEARERIATSLPYAKLAFSLREPISRLISWYRFAKQIGKLPQTLNFDAYVESLFATANDDKKTEEQHLQTLQQGVILSIWNTILTDSVQSASISFFMRNLPHNRRILWQSCATLLILIPVFIPVTDLK